MPRTKRATKKTATRKRFTLDMRERIAIRVNAAHLEAIAAAAARMDLTVSAFVRMAALQIARSGC
ncbi:hypothetical protein [Paraburkholderia sp. J12]|uniref:hypothetical protein n=1 Tax=Paraburkholderia sp. J12 TaxID=2805432 RepID=UPI002ABE8632|nr:hypothetical protein [Paraburkholderia sp. J12]